MNLTSLHLSDKVCTCLPPVPSSSLVLLKRTISIKEGSALSEMSFEITFNSSYARTNVILTRLIRSTATVYLLHSPQTFSMGMSITFCLAHTSSVQSYWSTVSENCNIFALRPTWQATISPFIPRQRLHKRIFCCSSMPHSLAPENLCGYLQAGLSMSTPFARECVMSRIEAGDTCDFIQPVDAGDWRRSAVGRSNAEGAVCIYASVAKGAYQNLAGMRGGDSSSVKSLQLDADTGARVHEQSEWTGLFHDRANLSKNVTQVCVPELYALSSNEQEKPENIISELKSVEKEELSLGQFLPLKPYRQEQWASSQVSYFRLSTGSILSASSTASTAHDDSPRYSVKPPRTARTPAQNEYICDTLRQQRWRPRTAPGGTSRQPPVGKKKSSKPSKQLKNRAPLVRLLSAVSYACAETSAQLDTTLCRLAQPKTQPFLETWQGHTGSKNLDSVSAGVRHCPGISQSERATKHAFLEYESGNPVICASLRESSTRSFPPPFCRESTECFSPNSVCGSNIAALVPDISCFNGLSAFHAKVTSSSNSLLTKIACAAGQLLASVTRLVGHAAAAAAAAVDDHSDSAAECNFGNYLVDRRNTARHASLFDFTFKATPFDFVLWASKGSRYLLQSPLRRSLHRTASAAHRLPEEDGGPDERPSCIREAPLRRKRVACLQAFALRLLLLICLDTPGWTPDLAGDDAGHTTNSLNDAGTAATTTERKRKRRNLPPSTSHWWGSTARDACATSTTPQKGLFGYLFREEADLLWQRWKRVTVKQQLLAEEKFRRLCNRDALHNRHGDRRERFEDETGMKNVPYQCGTKLIARATRRMLKVDSNLARLWAMEVPTSVNEEEFWKQYFYQVFHVMKRYERQAKPELQMLSRRRHTRRVYRALTSTGTDATPALSQRRKIPRHKVR